MCVSGIVGQSAHRRLIASVPLLLALILISAGFAMKALWPEIKGSSGLWYSW